MNFIRRIIDVLKQRVLIKKFGVKIGANYRINGVPILQGTYNSVTIGSNFIGNASQDANPIGYSAPLIFWTLGGGKIKIGDGVGISNAALVAFGADIVIEDNVMLGGGAKIYTSDFHSLDYQQRMEKPDPGIRHKSVLLKEGCFVGSGSIILKGVTIGSRSVIGAGAVVTKDVPDDEIWAGNPARFVKKIPKAEG